MKNKKNNNLKLLIAGKVRLLRQERRWTQSQLAKLLGLSQNRLSELERGQGSFSAENFLILLREFNLPVSYFAETKSASADQLQNALARLGAGHLLEVQDVLPSEELQDVLSVIKETIVDGKSSRQIAALAPVIVNHAGKISFGRLREDLERIGLGRRLAWVLDNTSEAVKFELDGVSLSRRQRILYRKTVTILERFLENWFLFASDQADKHDEVIDSSLVTPESIAEAREGNSPVSKKWNVISRMEIQDFIKALEAAHGQG